MWVWIILKSCISSAASSDWVCQTVVIKLQLNVLVYQPGGCQRAISPIRWNYPEIGLWLISPAYIYQLMWYWPSMNIFMYWKQSSKSCPHQLVHGTVRESLSLSSVSGSNQISIKSRLLPEAASRSDLKTGFQDNCSSTGWKVLSIPSWSLIVYNPQHVTSPSRTS